MLVTVITVVCNGESFLERAILSVLCQAYENIEYLIIDGGSTDGTLNIIKKYDKYLAKWISEKDDGIYSAMNRGINMSSGEYIGLLNSDDWYEPDAVSYVVQSLKSRPYADIIYGDMNIIDIDTQATKLLVGDIDSLPSNMSINHPTCFVKRALYKQRLFDTTFRIAADYDFMLYHKTSGANFLYIPRVLTNMSSGGISANNNITVQERFLIHLKYFGSSHAYAKLVGFKVFLLAKKFLYSILPPRFFNRLKGYK